MKINEVDPRNFDSDIDYYNALNAKPKARSVGEPRLSPAQQDAEDDNAISQQRQAAHAKFQQGRKVEYVNQEGSAPNGKEYNKLYVIHAKDAVTAQHEEYMFDKHEWGAKKVVDVQKEKNEDGTVTHTLFIVDNHKYGLWKPWKDKPAVENSFNHKPDDWSEDFERRMKPKEIDEKAPPGMEKWINDRKPEFKKRYGDKWQQVLYATAWKHKKNESVEESANDNPVAGAITRRILLQRADLLQKYGPEKVGQAIDDVADFVGDVEEIGSSDVSGWIKHVEQMLGNMGESVAEGSNNLRSAVLSVIQGIYNGAQAGEDMIDNVSDELGDYFNDVKRSKDQTLRNAYQLMRQQGAEAEGDPLMMAQVAKQAIDMLSQPMAEAEANPKDVICVDVPLFIRLMEYAREDASTDMDLHDVAERLIRLSAEGETVSMSSYDEIVGSQKEIKEADMDLEQGRKNILSILKAAEQGGNAEIIVGGEPITLEYPEARFVGGRYKSFMKAGRQEEFLRALTDARAFDRIMTKMRAVLDKQKNFRGSVPGERGVEEDAPAVAKFAGGLGVGLVAAAGAPAIVGILGPLLGIPFAAYGAYSAAKLGMKGVEKLWDMAAEKLGGDDKVEQYTQAKIAKLPPQEAQAAKAVIKQVSESRKSMAPNLDEGVVDAVKAGAKKAFKALTGPDDEELIQRLEKETGGKRPEKKDARDVKDVDEALLRATTRIKENEYFCMMDKQVKLIPEGYKRNSQGYLVRK